MLYMMIVKASKNSEQGLAPDEKLQVQMMEYNKALVSAGVRVMARGLHPTSEGIRIQFTDEGIKKVSGPFSIDESLVAGFFIIDVASHEEAVKWLEQAPDPQGFGEGEIELRKIYE